MVSAKINFRVYCLFHLAPRVRVYSHCRGLDIFFNFGLNSLAVLRAVKVNDVHKNVLGL